MKKKAASLTVYHLVGFILLAAVILFFVICFASGSCRNIIDRIDIIPSFNDTKPPIAQDQLIRYHISSDSIQYYDGVSWLSFQSQSSVILEDKEVYYNKAYQELATNYYFDESKRTGINDEKFAREFHPPLYRDNSIYASNLPFLCTSIIQIKEVPKGEIQIDLKAWNNPEEKCSGKKYGEYILTKENRIKYSGEKYSGYTDFTDKTEWRVGVSEIKRRVTLWRDSILSKPVTFTHYVDTDQEFVGPTPTPGKTSAPQEYCPDKVGDSYVLNLNSPSSNC
jgi:hypothetical protein